MDYADGAARWLSGTPVIPALYAATEGPASCAARGSRRCAAKSTRQTGRLIELADERGYIVCAPRDAARRGGTVAFDVPHAYEVAQFLLSRDIIVDYQAERRHSDRAAFLHQRRRARAGGRRGG